MPRLAELLFPKFLLFMQLFLKIFSGRVNSVDSDQTALVWVCTVCMCHFVRKFGV